MTSGYFNGLSVRIQESKIPIRNRSPTHTIVSFARNEFCILTVVLSLFGRPLQAPATHLTRIFQADRP